MSDAMITLDEVPLSRFHVKVVSFTAGGYFLDGYILGIIGIALSGWAGEVGFSSWWTGVIGAATLAGIFFGALCFGRVTDKVGRQPMFIIDLAVFIVLSVLQFFVSEPWQLLILRVLMGVAVGVDYTLASPLLAEFIPSKYRGRALGIPQAAAVTGIGVAFVIGYAMTTIGDGAWRWMLVSSTVPAIVVLLLRLGAPESPRWLASKGRLDEAQQVIRDHIGPNVVLGDEPVSTDDARFGDLFRDGMWRRTVFAGGFWMCQVMPFFALSTFASQVGASLGMRSDYTAGLALNIFSIVGVVAGLFFLDRFSRRGYALVTFLVSGVALALFGVLADTGAVIVGVICFAVYGLVLSAGTNLEGVFPAEAFPTSLRATGYGVATAISRLGAVVSTLFFPALLTHLGTAIVVIGLAVILFIGAAITWAWAPETRGMTLVEASSRDRKPQGTGRAAAVSVMPQVE